MEEREPVSLTSIGADGIGLQVVFNWHKDRHQHSIRIVMADQTILALESMEEVDEDNFPTSPPLQQLSVEELKPGVPVAFLVGMARKSHWSISIEPVDDRAAFVFDVACRPNGTVGSLQSCYRLLDTECALKDAQEASIKIEGGRTLSIRCDRDGSAHASLQQDSSGLRLKPLSTDLCGTIRWRYVMEILEGVT